ncbi:MAG: hypothetical protein KTR33_13880 [Gammaproteobacteria bacterium]|nr:hypothetical protein [Gammaproteobacteria bacterium]
MSLLTICQNAANEVGITAPSSLIGSTDQTAIRIYRAAVRTGSILSKKPWDRLVKRYNFNTVIGEPQYTLPSDYRSYVPGTLWNDTTDQEVFPASARRWTFEKVFPTSNYFDRARLLGNDSTTPTALGNSLTLHPTPTAVENIVFEYYSRNWVTNAAGDTEQDAFATDTDLTVFDEDLFELGVIWRLLKTLGQPYLEEKTEFDVQLEISLAQDGLAKSLHTDGNLPTLSNIPETGFGT